MSTQKEATIWQQLGDIIHRERVASGLSYGRMAKLSGISVRTLIHFEQGDNENGGKIGTLLAICESIGVNASDVFAELEGQPPKPGADAGTPRAAQAKRDAGASGSGVNDEGRQKIQAVRRL